MKEILESLSKLSEQITESKQQVAILQGRKEEVTKRLKEDYGLNSVEEAKGFVEKAEKELGILEKSIRKDYQKLQEEFKW